MSFLKKIMALLGSGSKPADNKEKPATNNPKPASNNAKPATPQPKFSVDTLTDGEKEFCSNAGISEDDGLLLKKLTRRPIEQFQPKGRQSNAEKPIAICSLTSEENARAIVLDNLDTFRKQGKYIFIGEIAHNGYKVALTATTSDPYKLMEYVRTNGVNHDIETEDIIEKYKKWDNEFGITTIAIGPDFCECSITNKDIDYKKLAGEVYEFCPDVVDQGTETVEALEEEMRRTGTIYLWWD